MLSAYYGEKIWDYSVRVLDDLEWPS